MNAGEDMNKMALTARWRESLTRCAYFIDAVLLHLIVFIMLAMSVAA